MKTRNYKINFRFVINPPEGDTMESFFYKYLVDWSVFMRDILSSSDRKAAVNKLPSLRKVLGKNFKLEDIRDLLRGIDASRTKSLDEIAPVFDRCSYDLKIYILACIGLTSKDYLNHKLQV